MEKRHFLSTTETAKLLGIHRTTVFRKIKEGKIKATKIGRNFCIDKKDLKKILEKELTKKQKLEIDRAIKKTVKEYGQTLKLLGTT